MRLSHQHSTAPLPFDTAPVTAPTRSAAAPADTVLARHHLDDQPLGTNAGRQVLLRPVGQGVTAPILIDSGELLVGRDSEPFSELDRSVVAMLSRRHARVFLSDGQPYVEDLGSLNGCFVDGQKVSTAPMVLEAGNELDFGGALRFDVELIEDVPAEQTLLAPQATMELHLEPTGGERLDRIVISRFPFVLSRNSDAFASLKQGDPEAFKLLSRRHALITSDGSRLYIEDLDSANGTFLGPKRVRRQPLALNDGDRLFFGDKRFGYEVRINVLDEERTIIGTAKSASGRSRPALAPAPAETCYLDLEQLREDGHLATPSVDVLREFRGIKRKLLASLKAAPTEADALRQSMMLVTSSLPGEGKSWIALNLALSMASEHDYRVLLVDAHAADNGLSSRLGLLDRPGLIDGLEDAPAPLDAGVLGTSVPGLSVLPLGQIAADMDELYASAAAAQQLEALASRDRNEIVIIDGPCLSAGTQAQTLAQQAGQTILVVEANRTPKDVLQANIATLSSCEGVGLLLNKKQAPMSGFWSRVARCA